MQTQLQPDIVTDPVVHVVPEIPEYLLVIARKYPLRPEHHNRYNLRTDKLDDFGGDYD